MRVLGFITKRPIILSLVLGLIVSSLSYFFQPLFPYHSIAHRGASAYAPENTMASFQKAVALGFDFIELDIRMSKDQELIVIHDADVKRTTNGEGFVRDLTVDELKQLDAGSWFHPNYSSEKIPLLSEVLDTFGGKINLLIEMKFPENETNMTEKLAHTLYEYFEQGLDPSTVKVQSFHIFEIKKFHQLCPEVSAGILLSKPLDMFHLASYRSFASFLAVHYRLLSKSLVNQALFFDYEIYTWTIQDQPLFTVMQKLGVHGIISNQEKKKTSKFTVD
ncbi:glycerophosphodiester phosphodiesterase family protein [Bacillus sp. 31A1R]|uniref:Glycerophosphodiester phosphodiesterase family protein n=1 Tax=Robertmurraya mangrovi TaxID=3098077 RepID=A0ABU5J5L9_9BACI|nr:glycerophosphodiester phosphodiesterase family protein [Bacillus sp. 31A1R]MDZ5474652.1 glycerophosphodiester phosphodiesterase family protein [Bacillus sp. 31A1R]